MAQYAQKCPNLRYRGHDETCLICSGSNMYTGNGSAARGGMNRGMALVDLHLSLNPEDLDGFHIIKGPTGKKRGRPQKPFEELSRTGQIMRLQAEAQQPPDEDDDDEAWLYGYTPSTKDDWARELRDRKKAISRCLSAGRGLGPTFETG